MRLYSYLKDFGNYTKSEVYLLFNESKVTVNNEKKTPSYIVKNNDKVCVNGILIKPIDKVYYIYNKPIGLLCTNDLTKSNSLIKHLNIDYKIHTVGRLDKDSHGLIILTNDGPFTNLVLSKETHIEKEYEVIIKDKVTALFLNKMQESIIIKGSATLEAKVKKIDEYKISVTLFEGKYHQVRLLVKNAGSSVVDLKRIRIGNLYLNDLKEDTLLEIKDLPSII